MKHEFKNDVMQLIKESDKYTMEDSSDEKL